MKVISGDRRIDGVLITEDGGFDDPVLSFHQTNTLGTGVTVTFNFLTESNRPNFEVMNASQRNAVLNILAMFETFANIEFEEIADGQEADIQFGNAALGQDGSGTVGITYLSFDTIDETYGWLEDVEVYLANDARVNPSEYENPQPDTFAYGVLIHEIGHVVERHGAEHMAKQGLIQGIAGAAGVVGGDLDSARMAQVVANFTMMKYGRNDELESDRWSVMLTSMAGYDPRAMLIVMDILDDAAGGGAPPEILSTHPKPANRKKYIEDRIKEFFPEGLPPGLRK